jgi:hypothetical protein
VAGLAPAPPAWKAGVLLVTPHPHTSRQGIEPCEARFGISPVPSTQLRAQRAPLGGRNHSFGQQQSWCLHPLSYLAMSCIVKSTAITHGPGRIRTYNLAVQSRAFCR